MKTLNPILQRVYESTPVLENISLHLPETAQNRKSSHSAKSDFTFWNRTTVYALAGLLLLWMVKIYSTWAAWGDLTIDSGHEMYVPALLAQGKLLYRDAWFMYGPAAPYFNSYLFRLFGIHLNVLYWAGALSALGSAVFLYLTGVRLSSWMVGLTAGAVLLAEAFQPSLFCFPLPYSFAAVYGCLVGCTFLWLTVNASFSTRKYWILALGGTAALALLLKPEFGIACYIVLILLIALRTFQQRSFKLLAIDLLQILPGLALCLIVIAWMVSIAGVDFITQENVVSWPTSYFMHTYGRMWLEKNGFTLTVPAFIGAAYRSVPLLAAMLLVFCYLWWKKATVTLRIALSVMFVFLLCVIYMGFIPAVPRSSEFSAIFFPQDMVLYVCIATVVHWWRFWRNHKDQNSIAIMLAFTFSTLLAFRILMGTYSEGYSIYYNGPVVLCFLLLAVLIVPRTGRTRAFVYLGQACICLGCLAVVLLHARAAERSADSYVPLVTDRGTIRVWKDKAKQYEMAIQFIKERASAGESVLSVPEDTSLYFLTNVPCPIRLYSFTPGVLAPGKMTEDTIRELESKHIRYLLWSNRIFPEFGTPVFGKDFDQPVGEYLKTHYRPLRRLMPYTPGVVWHWSAVIWERIPDEELRSAR